jgi:2,3-bisphosphoglycerate-dependent phosphoglycerate mutase
MQKTFYIVRHCKATGQAADAHLSPEGEQQAIHLAEQLAPLSIERIISSPYIRAIRTITPLAERLELPIITDERLIERVLSTSELDDWMTALGSTFENFDLSFAGGESSRVATQRIVEVLYSAMLYPVRTTVIVTHGNLMTLLLKHLNPEVDFTIWQQLKNPDVYHIELEGTPTIVHRMARMNI